MAGSSRYFWAVFYPENCLDNWQSCLDDIIQVPYVYIVHDKDTIEHHQFQDLEFYNTRKLHVHIIIAFNNTTTAKHALNVINSLSLPGRKCCPGVQPVYSMMHCYEYLIHNTKSSQHKHHYKPEERIEGNCFDLGAYISVSQEEKDKCLRQIYEDIQASVKTKNPLCNIGELTHFYFSQGLDESDLTFQCIKGYRSLVADWCKWVYFKQDEIRRDKLVKIVHQQQKRIKKQDDIISELTKSISKIYAALNIHEDTHVQ